MESPREKQLPRGHPAAASLRAIQAAQNLQLLFFTPQRREPPPPKLLQLRSELFGFTVRFTAASARRGQKEMM